jgi:hypothetical protein
MPVEGGDQLGRFLSSRASMVQQAIIRALQAQMLNLQSHIVADKLSGQVLHHRTGKLIDSIRLEPTTPEIQGDTISAGVVGGGALAPYGKFHEFGTASAYFIYPKLKKALAFIKDGHQVVVMKVLHPPIQERSFMRSSLEDLHGTIIAGVQAAIDKALSS